MNRFAMRLLPVFLALLATCGVAAGPPAGYEFHWFSAPGAYDTGAWGLTNQRVAMGLYYPPDFSSCHGFLFSIDGGLITYDYPGATYTLGYQGNEHGEIAVGVFSTPVDAFAAIYDSRRGTWRTLPAPDPTAVLSQAASITDGGLIFGYWCDNPFYLNNHGWLYKDGTYTFFDVPGAARDNEGTIINGANSQGDVVGEYVDGAGQLHGFLRHGNDGHIDAIDVPASLGSGTRPLGLNSRGTIVGKYDGPDGRRHGFILEHGVFTTFDIPGVDHTFVTSINDRGDLVGLTRIGDAPSTSFIAIRNGK
jgi:hypothetical protein